MRLVRLHRTCYAMPVMRVHLFTLVATAVIGGCGETVVTSSESTGAAAGAESGGGGQGGVPSGIGGAGASQGGAAPTCGEACIECCNDPACPSGVPAVGNPCAAPLDCSYVNASGCLELWVCSNNDPDPDSWSKSGMLGESYECPGSCPPTWPDLSFNPLCFDPEAVCAYQLTDNTTDYGCWSFACSEDHHWQSPVKIGDVCP